MSNNICAEIRKIEKDIEKRYIMEVERIFILFYEQFKVFKSIDDAHAFHLIIRDDFERDIFENEDMPFLYSYLEVLDTLWYYRNRIHSLRDCSS